MNKPTADKTRTFSGAEGAPGNAERSPDGVRLPTSPAR